MIPTNLGSLTLIQITPKEYTLSLNFFLVPLRFIIISLVFCYLSKLVFSGFLQCKGKFVRGKNTVTGLIKTLRTFDPVTKSLSPF